MNEVHITHNNNNLQLTMRLLVLLQADWRTGTDRIDDARRIRALVAGPLEEIVLQGIVWRDTCLRIKVQHAHN